MSELVVVTNRGPASLYQDDAGVTRVRHAAGGLAPSLGRALSQSNATWVAAATTDLERRATTEGVPDFDSAYGLRLVAISPAIANGALRVIANSTLWFCHHGLFDRPYRPIFNRMFHDAWEQFRIYNAAMAAAVAEEADDQATVVVNDYHLCLMGGELSRLRPDLKTVHFSHTPFCSTEELSVLPSSVATELVVGLSSFGACGFHTQRWADRFTACAREVGVNAPSVFVSPLGVDGAALTAFSSSAACQEKRSALRERLGNKKLILRSDRLELSKNVVRGFLAFEELLVEQPDLVGSVVFVARVYPSREDLPEYLAYRSTVEHVVERINERFGTAGYLPIELEVEDDFTASVAASSCYDVLLVNPVRDGMNLVAKEGPIVNDNDGVLLLSKEAGSIAELGGPAIEVHPFDVSQTAQALGAALAMAPDERHRRSSLLKELAPGQSPEQWFSDVIDHACAPHASGAN